MATLDTATIIIDQDGKLAYLTPTTLEVYDTGGADLGIFGIMSSGYSDLGEPSVDKLLNYVDIDYIGQCSIFFEFTSENGRLGGTSVFLLPNRTSRSTYQLYIPLDERKAFQKMRYWLTEPTHGTIIYNMEIDFSVLKRRRYY